MRLWRHPECGPLPFMWNVAVPVLYQANERRHFVCLENYLVRPGVASQANTPRPIRNPTLYPLSYEGLCL
jgi:hypothetical protein